MGRPHLTLHLPLKVLDDFLLLEESLLELISSLRLLGWSPGNLSESSFQESDLQGEKNYSIAFYGNICEHFFGSSTDLA